MKKQEPFDFGKLLTSKFDEQSTKKARVPLDPKDFVFNYVKTLDPHWELKGSNPESNPWPPQYNIDPVTGEKTPSYSDIIIDVWQRERHILVPKSRQMMITWLTIALTVHEAITKKSQMIFYVSKKEDDAGFGNELSLTARAKFIVDHLPEAMRPQMIVTKRPAQLFFPELNSTIQGMSQDAEALRMYTASRIFLDELAFQDNAHTSYAALKPTIQGGGKLIGVSTPCGKNSNLFYMLVHDKSGSDD